VIMSILHYVKASDIEYDFCFLEVSRNESAPPFMDIRISDDRKLEFFIYKDQADISLSVEEWKEIHDKSLLFLKSEIENEESFKNWGD
jgi:hypothetical protein